jgi:hypothetical protein
MKKASETYLKGILEVTSDEVVSSDFIHHKASSIFDEGSGIELNKRFFKLVSWYDNEWGYSNRVVELVTYILSKVRECGFVHPPPSPRTGKGGMFFIKNLDETRVMNNNKRNEH